MPPHLLLELLTVSRTYRTCFNAIDLFVCYPEKQTLDFFMEHLHTAMVYRMSPKIDKLLGDIYMELLDKENNSPTGRLQASNTIPATVGLVYG